MQDTHPNTPVAPHGPSCSQRTAVHRSDHRATSPEHRPLARLARGTLDSRLVATEGARSQGPKTNFFRASCTERGGHGQTLHTTKRLPEHSGVKSVFWWRRTIDFRSCPQSYGPGRRSSSVVRNAGSHGLAPGSCECQEFYLCHRCIRGSRCSMSFSAEILIRDASGKRSA